METHVEKTIEWFADLCRDGSENSLKARSLFFKRLFLQLSREECKKVGNMLYHFAKEKLYDELPEIRQTKKQKTGEKNKDTVNVVSKGAQALSKPTSSESVNENEQLNQDKFLAHVNLAPNFTVMKRPWWYSQDILAFDCEFVIGETNLQELAQVTLVDLDGNVIYKEKVFRRPGTFKPNKITIALNGIRKYDLYKRRYKDFEVVVREFKEKVKGKILVGHGMTNDLAALELATYSDVILFDLQYYFWFEAINCNGSNEILPHSLRSLAAHFFPNEPFQVLNEYHDDEQDARMTAKIFKKYQELKIFLPEENVEYRETSKGDVEGIDLSKKPERSLGWPNIRQAFVRNFNKETLMFYERAPKITPITTLNYHV